MEEDKNKNPDKDKRPPTPPDVPDEKNAPVKDPKREPEKTKIIT